MEIIISNSHYTSKGLFNLFGFDIIYYFKEYIDVNTYVTPDLTMNHTLGSKLDSVRTQFPFLAYDTMESIMKISDYNEVEKFYGIQEYSLDNDEYIIVADFKSMVHVRNIALENNEVIHSIFGIIFAVKVLEVFGNEQLLPSIIATAIFIVIIYGGYFMITYYCSKNIIK